MKTLMRRCLLSHKLRSLKREIDYVYQVRRETVRRESALKYKADKISHELMTLELRRHA